MRIPFTVLGFDIFMGRLSATRCYSIQGKILRVPNEAEWFCMGLFNLIVCWLLGHKQCDIADCDCGICMHCGTQLTERKRKGEVQ